MAIIKCKMCGGALEVTNESIATCEYCGTQQTLPKLDGERKANLYDRANHFRRNNEFDKAMGIYEQILNEDTTDAESYWSLVLCRYGIEYVEDPASHKRLPTVNRAQFTSVFDDDNYKAALQYADACQRRIYEEEANAINEIQKSILAISQKEAPFDVFICYKETDHNGRRTPDSVLANDLYHQLIQEGFKVFFSRVTLEDKLGSAYEPYIFAALNSARVMVVLGTKPEYFNAVWVKNEWSRYLALIKSGAKKTLVPAYKDMDPYNLPEEFSHLQAQDMSKLGFMQDLIRGIKKIAQAEPPKTAVIKETVVTNGAATVAPLLRRAFMFLEDGDWSSANEYCEKVLDIEPENAQAYWGKVLADARCSNKEAYVTHILSNAKNVRKTTLVACAKNTACEQAAIQTYTIPGFLTAEEIAECFDHGNLTYISETEGYKESLANVMRSLEQDRTLSRAITFASGELATQLAGIKESIVKELENLIEWSKQTDEQRAKELVDNYANRLTQAESRAKDLYDARWAQRDKVYQDACACLQSAKNVDDCHAVAKTFDGLYGYEDSELRKKQCMEKANQLEAEIRAKIAAEQEARRQQAEINRLEAERRAKRKKRMVAIIVAIIGTIIGAIIAFIQVLNSVIIPNGKYEDAVALIDAGEYLEAYKALIALDGYKDSAAKATSVYNKYKMEVLKKAKIGDYVFFGSYEQDNDTSNGTEKIEWLVLEVKNGKALLISKYALDCNPYDYSNSIVTWESCPLRKWLNNDFVNNAFTVDEIAIIPAVTVSADENPEFVSLPGNATQDQIFLLSIAEANKYFSSDDARQCKPTDYAVASGAKTDDGTGSCWWWLRTPGNHQRNAACVNTFGDVSTHGRYVSYAALCVRPALWVDLNG